MIDYNYKIERIVNDKGSIKTFVPTKIPTSLPDITYIEGPNSSGKSTLLNIIAIALYGQKNSTIIESLKKKMNSLMDAGHQKLSFEFKITNKSGNLELEGKKTADNNDISLYHYIDGKRKPLGPENFDQNYNLIYNIPFNPTDRLSSLTDGIEKSQLLYSNALSQLRFKLTEYISEITKKDPKKIETLKKRFKNLSADVKKTEDTLPILTKKLDLLETAVYFELYHKYQKELNEIQSEINEIGNNITKTVKKVKKGSKAYIAAKFSTKLGIDAIDLTFNKICNNIRSIIQMGKFPKRKELSDILNLSRDIAFVSTLESLEFPTNLTYIITQASELLKVIRGSVDPNLLNEAKMYKELLQVLNLYQNLEATLPGDKSIKDFITELKNIYDEKQGIVDLCAKIDATKELLVNISQKISVITQTDFPTLRKLKRDISDAEEEVETKKGDVEKDNRLHVLKTQEKECLKFLKEYEKKYASKGSPPPHEVCRLGFGELKEYFKMDEALLLNTIETLRKQIAQKTADKMQKEAFLPGIEKEIHDIEQIEDHRYQKNLAQLNKLLEISSKLDSKFKNNFHEYLLQITKKTRMKSPSPEQKEYNTAIFEYLGDRLGKIPHIDGIYEIKYVDLLEETMITKQNEIIKFMDMGTGQSQSAYLTSLLNSEKDRKIIALFDEIAMMDEKSLDKVYSRLRELYEKDKLLLAIVVQKANKNVKIVDLRERKTE